MLSKCGIILFVWLYVTPRGKHPAPVWIRRPNDGAQLSELRVTAFRSFSRFLRAAGDAGTRPSTCIRFLLFSALLLAFSVPAGNPFEKWPLWITRIEILRWSVGELRGRCRILALPPGDAVPPTACVSKQN